MKKFSIKQLSVKKLGVKEGAASFYIVAIATLILLVLAVSFATVIMSGIERTSNEDLSQSAYDSAMAGVEDAKLAFYNYRTCKEKVSLDETCRLIVAEMESDDGDCSMVGKMVGRIDFNDDGEVVIEESTATGDYVVTNNMQQAYTCAKIKTLLNDYRSTLSATNPTRVIKPSLNTKTGSSVSADSIDRVKISWYLDEETAFTNFFSNGVAFPAIGKTATATPPTISVALVQTAELFNMEDFEMTVEDDVTGELKTDRGMVYLVPASGSSLGSGVADGDEAKALFGAYKRGTSSTTADVIPASAFLKSNDHQTKNLPYAVDCDKTGGEEFVCSAILELPEPVRGLDGSTARSDDTFTIVVSLPYGRPKTDFAVEFLCESGAACGSSTSEGSYTAAYLSGSQVQIDVTGRANDIYRRVEARLEASTDSSYISLLGPLEITGGGEDESGDDGEDSTSGVGTSIGLDKNYTVLNDWAKGSGVLAHDTVVLVDTTGSMGGVISGAKQQAIQLGRETLDLGGRYALYEYRDGNVDGPGYQPVTERCGINDCTVDNFEAAINSLSVGGGGDFPESALASAYYIMDTVDWEPHETKAIVILTDASYLDPDYDGTTLQKVIDKSKAVDKGYPVQIYAVGSGATYFTELAEATGGRVVPNFGDLWLYTDESEDW